MRGHDTSTKQLRFQKAGKTSLLRKIVVPPQRRACNFGSAALRVHSAPAVSGSTAGASIWMEVGGHSPFIEYLKALWWPRLQRESDPQVPLR